MNLNKTNGLKTKYKWIEFHWDTVSSCWIITNHRYDQLIGQLEFNKKWKEWEFIPYEDTGWTLICLEDVIDFIKKLKDAKYEPVQTIT